MTDSILNEGFFDNKDVPDSAKLGAIALLLNGTFETYKRGNGNVVTFVSHVGGNK